MTKRGDRSHAAGARQLNDLANAAAETAAGIDLLLLDAERLAHAIAAGVHGRRRAGPGETFWQHRPYGFGDAASSIDWRQSARGSGRLYVRQTEWEAAATAWLWSDPSASMNFSSRKDLPTKRWRADVIATALTMLLARGGERIGLIGGRPAPYHGRAAPRQFLEALTAQEPEGASAPVIEHVSAGAAAIFIGDFYEEPAAIERAAAAFAEQGANGCLIQIVDPAEEAFPFDGRVEFSDLESAARVTFGDAGSIRQAYRSAFAAHRAALEALCDSLGWRFVIHSTDAPATEALLSVYMALIDGRDGRRGGAARGYA